MREGYRLQKPLLYTKLPVGRSYHLSLIYTGAEIMDQAAIQKSITQALERWLSELSKHKDADPAGSHTRHA